MTNQIYYYEIIDSTNEELKRLAEKGISHGSVAVAKEQTAGKGRRGRQWYSPNAGNLYFSILLRPPFGADKASLLTLIMALSVAQAFYENGCRDARIKWPNDIVVNGRKVCGILTELQMQPGGDYFVIVGVGINIGNEEFTEEIRHMATTLSREMGGTIDSREMLSKILFYFNANYTEYERVTDFSILRERYEFYLLNKDVTVNVLDPKGEFRGIAKGVNEDGELLVEKEDGNIVTVYAGEVSVRGIYGYV